jgi:hypothetical protein
MWSQIKQHRSKKKTAKACEDEDAPTPTRRFVFFEVIDDTNMLCSCMLLMKMRMEVHISRDERCHTA